MLGIRLTRKANHRGPEGKKRPRGAFFCFSLAYVKKKQYLCSRKLQRLEKYGFQNSKFYNLLR